MIMNSSLFCSLSVLLIYLWIDVLSLISTYFLSHSVSSSLWKPIMDVQTYVYIHCVWEYEDHKHIAQGTGQSLLDMFLFLLLAVLSHKLSPARSERRQGFQSVKLPWVEDYPSRLSAVSVTHFSTQTWKRYPILFQVSSVTISVFHLKGWWEVPRLGYCYVFDSRQMSEIVLVSLYGRCLDHLEHPSNHVLKNINRTDIYQWSKHEHRLFLYHYMNALHCNCYSLLLTYLLTFLLV